MVDWYRDRQTDTHTQTQINNITYVVLAPWLTGIETDRQTHTQTQTNNITYVVLAPCTSGLMLFGLMRAVMSSL